MAYPRQCEGCGKEYGGLVGFFGFAHVTLAAEDGGTPSPWLPDKPGRVLELGCRFCGAIFRWDYFGRSTGGRIGRPLGLMRRPVAGWQAGDPFVSGPVGRAGARRGP